MRFLIVDDVKAWQRRLVRVLRSLYPDATIDIADSSGAAVRLFQGAAYDLAVMDLALLGEPPDGVSPDELGFELAKGLRSSRDNLHCGLIVVTGYPSSKRILEAVKRHSAFDFIEKDAFEKRRFIDATREALRESLLFKSRERLARRYRLEITLSEQGFVDARLSGPKRASFQPREPVTFDMHELTERGDHLNLMVLTSEKGEWRKNAEQLGRTLFEALVASHPIGDSLLSALSLPMRESDLCIHFRGPASVLAVPFELLKDKANNYLCFRHLFTRDSEAGAITRKTDRFDQFLERLIRAAEPLRILVIGANADGQIPAAEAEAIILSDQLERTLDGLGILHDVVLLKGASANYKAVTEALHEGRFHILHYAGHGRYEDAIPEVSGLVLRDRNQLRTLRASDLNLLLQDSDLQFVYLSCCLGARTTERIGRGDFYGVFDALARVDVPTVLGYRWTVLDKSALAMAKHFYRELLRTFSPAEALLAARRAIAMGEIGWDDETWASPVLLSKNP